MFDRMNNWYFYIHFSHWYLVHVHGWKIVLNFFFSTSMWNSEDMLVYGCEYYISKCSHCFVCLPSTPGRVTLVAPLSESQFMQTSTEPCLIFSANFRLYLEVWFLPDFYILIRGTLILKKHIYVQRHLFFQLVCIQYGILTSWKK